MGAGASGNAAKRQFPRVSQNSVIFQRSDLVPPFEDFEDLMDMQGLKLALSNAVKIGTCQQM